MFSEMEIQYHRTRVTTRSQNQSYPGLSHHYNIILIIFVVSFYVYDQHTVRMRLIAMYSIRNRIMNNNRYCYCVVVKVYFPSFCYVEVENLLVIT